MPTPLHVNISIPRDLRARLDRARHRGFIVNCSALARHAIAEALADVEAQMDILDRTRQ